jgi:ATP synthase protein I
MMMQTQLRDMAIARAVCLAQLGVLLAAALLCGAVWGRQQAIAAAYGGLVAVLSSAYLSVYALIRSEGMEPAKIVGAFYRGEVGKFVLAAALFVVGVKLFAPEFLFLMVTFAASQLVYWVVLGLKL